MLNMIWIDGIRSRNLDKPHFRQYLPPHPAQDSTRLVDVSHNLEVSVYQQSHLGPSDTVQAGQSGPGDLTRPVSQILVIINLENIGKSVFNIQTYEISRAHVFSWEAGGWPKFTWLSSPPWSWCRRACRTGCRACRSPAAPPWAGCCCYLYSEARTRRCVVYYILLFELDVKQRFIYSSLLHSYWNEMDVPENKISVVFLKCIEYFASKRHDVLF